MNLSGRYRLSPEVSLRPEHFGGLLYHHGQGKLYFLYSPTLVSVLSSLSEGRALDEAVDYFARHSGLTSAELTQLQTTLEKLKQIGVLDAL